GFHRPPQQGNFVMLIGVQRARAKARHHLAVSLDHGNVDAVHRRAAHQADRPHSPKNPDSMNPVPDLLHHRPGGSDPVIPSFAMSDYKSDFLRVLSERGFIHQISDAAGLDARAAAGPITAYVGYDATAPSLHIGNLLTIMMLR